MRVGDAALVQEDQLFRRDRAEPLEELFPPAKVFFRVALAGVE
jgi:hypothetical protein